MLTTAAANHDISQAQAAIKRLESDGNNTIGDRDVNQAVAGIKMPRLSMLVTPLPIVMLPRLVQSPNALFPILVTLSGILKLLKSPTPKERPVPDVGNAVRDNNIGYRRY